MKSHSNHRLEDRDLTPDVNERIDTLRRRIDYIGPGGGLEVLQKKLRGLEREILSFLTWTEQLNEIGRDIEGGRG